MPDASFPWVVIPAYAILAGARWINRWMDQPPRPKPPTIHETPVQVRIIRRGTSQELERRDR